MDLRKRSWQSWCAIISAPIQLNYESRSTMQLLVEYQRARRVPGIFFLPFPTRACLCPPSPNNLEYLLAVSKNLAHPLHPVYDDGNGGGWKWWE